MVFAPLLFLFPCRGEKRTDVFGAGRGIVDDDEGVALEGVIEPEEIRLVAALEPANVPVLGAVVEADVVSKAGLARTRGRDP